MISKLLPSGWEYANLDNIVIIILGQSPSSSTYNDHGDGLPFFQGKLEFGELHPTVQKWCNQPNKLAYKGDVLLSVRAPVGATNIATERCCIGRGLAALHPVAEVNPLFILYLVRAFERKLAEQSTGSTFDAITGDRLKKIELPIPPLPEQHCIVTKIEELFTQLDAGVASLKKVQAQLKRYRQAVLKAAFEGRLTQEWREEHKGEIEPVDLSTIKKKQILIDEKKQTKFVPLIPIVERDKEDFPENWSISRIGEVVRIIDYRGRTPPYSETGIPHLRSQNIKNGKIVWENLAFVTEDIYNQYMTRGLPIKGDILFTTEAPLGEVALAPEQKFSIAQRIMLLRPFEKILVPKFLMYQIKSDFFQNQLNRKGTGTTVTGVSSRNFQPIIVKIPSMLEQNRIVEEIERCFSITDEIEKTITSSIRQAETLRQSILKRAFEGKLVPQNPNDEPASILLERIKAEKTRHMTEIKKGKTLQPKSLKRKVRNAN